jgi:hypothetical protein
MYQSRIGDLGFGQVEDFQLREALQMHQPRIGDLGFVQVERLANRAGTLIWGDEFSTRRE